MKNFIEEYGVAILYMIFATGLLDALAYIFRCIVGLA